MISNVDLKDWIMLTQPLKLKNLKDGEMFSVFGDNKMFKLLHKTNEIAFAETREIFNSFALPSFMEVYPWVLKQNANQKATSN